MVCGGATDQLFGLAQIEQCRDAAALTFLDSRSESWRVARVSREISSS